MKKKYSAGIDIGSTCAKTIVLDKEGNVVYKDLRPTGYSSIDTAESIRHTIEEAFGKDSFHTVATGYGFSKGRALLRNVASNNTGKP